MKKILILFFTVSLMMISAPRESTDSRENIINHLDINYSYNIAESLTKFKTNEKLGFRTAGSSAEHAAGDMLYEEFKKLGLKNVRKDEFTVDAWEFKNAELTYTDKKNFYDYCLKRLKDIKKETDAINVKIKAIF